ncbi:MAG TPA: TfuA-like protein [Polyangiaceae bacterium]|nr:TfuA-like protein [Polyangiaceae bacterium]
MKIAVYTGLTLKASEVEALLPGASVRPPVKQFDVLRDIQAGFHVVVIIDGVFHQTPAVSPSEIMDALRRGLLVYGCSSMGALRAAELCDYGMRGHGAIFEWVRDDPAFRDDFPGQIFTREGAEIRALSITYVDFVFNLRQLAEQGRLSAGDQRFLEQTFRNIYYPERTVGALVAALKPTRPELIPIAKTALTELGSQKRRDALATLERVHADLTALQQLNRELTGAADSPKRAPAKSRAPRKEAKHAHG